MKTRWILAAILFAMPIAAHGQSFDTAKTQNWHHWRGPLATGTAPQGNPPVEWGPDQNIQWKVEIPGEGSATPIIWQDKVFVVTVIDSRRVNPDFPPPEEQPERNFGIVFPHTYHQFVVLCFDRNSGRELWRRTANEIVPHEGTHGDNNFASASPTTDGERLYVWFGSAGLYCYDLEGELLWKRNLGEVNMRLSFGEGASPVVYQDRLVINRDNEGRSYITVLNSETGETIWTKDRDEVSSWNTPFVVEHDGQVQVIVNASNRVRSYDLEDGELIWECGGQVGNVTPSPIAWNGLAICMSGYRGSVAQAIPLSSRGDLNESALAWSLNRGTPYVPSPVLYEGTVYFNASNNAILTSVDAESGETMIREKRLPDLRRIYASPVAAAGKIYFTARDGTTLVLQHGDEVKILATNRLEEPIDASPAIVGNQLFLRSYAHLYCISQ